MRCSLAEAYARMQTTYAKARKTLPQISLEGKRRSSTTGLRRTIRSNSRIFIINEDAINATIPPARNGKFLRKSEARRSGTHGIPSAVVDDPSMA
jgi:hypothetical protein